MIPSLIVDGLDKPEWQVDSGYMTKIRLNKFIAEAGIASRRKADEIIQDGLVKVNGQVVTKLGILVDPDHDEVKCQGKILRCAEQVIFMFNKPKGVTSTMSDQHADYIVADYFKEEGRVFPVGRLDKDSEGLLLVTNNGALANKLMHPRYEHEKEYEVVIQCHAERAFRHSGEPPKATPESYNNQSIRSWTSHDDDTRKSSLGGRKDDGIGKRDDKRVPEDDIVKKFSQSFRLDGRKTKPMRVKILKKISSPHPPSPKGYGGLRQTSPYQGEERRGCWLISLILQEGRKRQIRHIATVLGYKVKQLKRVRIGKLKLGHLPVGKYTRVLEKDII